MSIDPYYNMDEPENVLYVRSPSQKTKYYVTAFTWKSRIGKFIETENALIAAYSWKCGRNVGIRGESSRGFLLQVMKIVSNSLWCWLHASVNILKTTELYKEVEFYGMWVISQFKNIEDRRKISDKTFKIPPLN